MINLYQILDVSHSATMDEIRANYRRKAMEFHPDRNPENKWATDQFQKVNAAYNTLNDPTKRQHYDTALQEYYGGGRPHAEGNQPPEWLSNVFSMGMNLAENWARGVAEDAVSYSDSPSDVGDFADSLSISMRKEKKSGNIVLSVNLTPEDQSELLHLCTQFPLDGISEEVASLVAERFSSYFERKWRTG